MSERCIHYGVCGHTNLTICECREGRIVAHTVMGDIVQVCEDYAPRLTCQNVGISEDYFRCSKCGCELMRAKDGWKTLYMGEVNYCPNCGAKVVD